MGFGGLGTVPSSKAATLLGVGAILLWATLASLTALSGPIPPFETTAIVFLIGGVVVLLAAAARGRLPRVVPTPSSLALRVAGLFRAPAPCVFALKQAVPLRAT